jgi:hypothetical protein
MTTLIISSIIALLVIAVAAILIGKWIKRCEDHVELMRQISESQARALKMMESVTDFVAMEKLLLEAKEILKQKQP